MKKYLEMFISFFKIGAFTLGGGYAMLPLIQKEIVDKKGWISKEDFFDMIAIAQSAPGPIAVNTAVFVGYKIEGYPGSFFTTLGSILPSFIIIILAASVFIGIKDNVFVLKAFKGIEPAVVALIAAPVLSMSKEAKINRKTVIIPIVVAVVVAFFRVTPILIIILAAFGGIIYMAKWGRQNR